MNVARAIRALELAALLVPLAALALAVLLASYGVAWRSTLDRHNAERTRDRFPQRTKRRN